MPENYVLISAPGRASLARTQIVRDMLLDEKIMWIAGTSGGTAPSV